MWLQKIGGGARRLALGGLNPSGQASIGATGAVAFTATEADHPAELYFLANSNAEPVRLTHLQTVTDGVSLGRQETVQWKSDGFDVDGVLTYPPGYTPGKEAADGALHPWRADVGLDARPSPRLSQSLAAQGWLVIEPNYRGSDNEGNAFQTAILGHASSGPGRDIIAGVEALKARGIVDEADRGQRLVVRRPDDHLAARGVSDGLARRGGRRARDGPGRPVHAQRQQRACAPPPTGPRRS